MKAAWLLPGLALACSPSSDVPIHAEAWVGPGSLGPEAAISVLSGAPVSVEGTRRDGRFRVVASAEALEELSAAGLTVELHRLDHRVPPGQLPSYHDADEMTEALWALAEGHPEDAELVELGRSVQGRPITALRVGQGGWRVRVLGAHHGDELSSSEMALRLAERLLEDPVQVELWIVPQVNPDGVADGSRYNARQVDLNRNYGYQWSDSEYLAGDAPFSEPESRAMRVLSAYRGFGTGLSMHGGAELICYVWNYSTEPTADASLLVEWSEGYRRACGLDGFYIINGADWYVTHGDSTDWSYGRQGSLDFTLELSEDKAPPEAELEELLDAHMDAVLDFVQREPSLLGAVVDAVDGLPVEATVKVEGAVTSLAGPDGRFARWLHQEGPQVIEIEAPGYLPQRLELELTPGQAQDLDLSMERSSLLHLRPEPALLTWGDEERSITLPGVQDQQVELWRPGFPSVTLRRSGDAYTVVPSELAPGPWGIRADEGSAPRALFVGERSDRVRLLGLSLDDAELLVQAEGLGAGSRAWVLSGDARGMTPLPVLAESDDELRLDARVLERLEGVLDLLVVSAGAQVVALDLAAGAVVDTGAPVDTQQQRDDSDLPGDSLGPVPSGGACGCLASRARGFAPILFLVTLGTVLTRRRARWNPGRARLSLVTRACPCQAPLAPDRRRSPGPMELT